MRLIDADAMRAEWLEDGENEYVYDTNCMLDSIDKQPTIDAKPVQHGKWIKGRKEKLYYGHGMVGYYDYPELCSVCHYDATEHGRGVGNYCPNCGSKMDLE